jgi:hypothetical protein
VSCSIFEQLVRHSVVPMACTIAEMRVRSRKRAWSDVPAWDEMRARRPDADARSLPGNKVSPAS